ncbi:MAG: hypothetical protein DMG59_09485 [Acidobacteria bacterium]|nr:MAG: hypothetical protein DMG59_09485 [Acidobacteriota bacterium]
MKKTSPLVWILGGVAVFFCVVLMTCGVFGYLAMRAVKNAGFDPDLMQRNPGLAMAKMAGALHPDLKVVSTDDRNGIITMTEKSTGKIVKLKFDPDKKTMVVIGDDGKEVKISATGDEKSGSLPVQSEEGAVRFGAAAGNASPAWVPVYPGSAAEGTYAAQTPGGNQSTFTFKTKDAPAKVMSYYQDQLKSAGFTINLISGGDEGGMVQAENASKTRSVILTVGSSSEGTQGSVMAAEKK